MSFKDLKSLICNFYEKHAAQASVVSRVRVREQVLDAYRQQHGHLKWLAWRHFLMRSSAFSLVGFVALSFLGIVEAPFLSNKMVAGTIKSNSGVVEIIRGNESFLVKNELVVRSGDIIKIGHRGDAVFSTDSLVSKIKEGTAFRVKNESEVFVMKGVFQGESLAPTKIRTERASITGTRGSGVEVMVSSAGETTVQPLEKTVQVVDLYNGRLIVKKGDIVSLRSDTRLNTLREVPEGISLSNTQIAAVLGKLAITRTKILTGLERSSLGDRRAANRDLVSAEKTFLSVLSVLEASRDMDFAPKKNVEQIALQEVYIELQAKTMRADVLTEAKALEIVFDILARNKNSLSFAPLSTGVRAYDRYVLLNHLASLGSPEETTVIKYLAENYIVSALRKIQNEPIKIDQIALLKTLIDQLPVNDSSYEFLARLQSMMAPDLGSILGEKIENLF